MKLKSLSQQTIVITGGSSGIGLATAKMAARQGARVVILSRDEQGLKEIVEEIAAQGGEADHVVGDVGKREDMRKAVETIVERHGGFDTWVNNAGVGAYATIEELSDRDHERMFQTNYWGVVYGSTEALKHLKGKGGAIINVGSISSDMPAPILSAYTATKFAVKGLTDSLRLELIHDEVPVSLTLIQPSGVHTPFGEHAKNYMEKASKVPPPVYAPELVAEAICHAAENPTRSLMIGGSGRLMTWAARVAPALTDRIFARTFFITAKEKDKAPRQHEGGFHEPGSSGTLYGDQDDHMRKTSLYTSWQTRKGASLAALAAIGLAGIVATGWLLKPKALGAQRPVPIRA